MKRKIIHALLAFAIAFGLWVYVITVVNPESEDTFYNVPVVLNNGDVLNDNGLMVVLDKEPTVTLKLKGNRSDLNNLDSSNIKVVADLSGIDAPGETKLNYSVAFQGNKTFEIVSQEPQVITLTIAEWASKEVMVNVSYLGTTPADYIAYTEGVKLDYEKVTVTGPKEVVDKITQAVIEVDIDGKSETISESYRYTLCDEAGNPVDAATVKTNVPEIQLTLRILQVKEVPLVLDVTYGGGATEQNTQITIDPLTIKVAGSEKLLEGFDKLVLGAVNLSELAEEAELTFPVNLPEGIENISGVEDAAVSIKFPGLKAKTFKVTRILPSNSAGVKVTLNTTMIEVTVRGTVEQIDAMTDLDLYARVDCTGADLGENRFKAQIFVDNRFDTVGVVGSYYVYAVLTADGSGT